MDKHYQVEPPSQGIIKQYALDTPFIMKKLDCLLSSVVLSDSIRLSSVPSNVSGVSEWLNAIPTKS